MDKRLKQWALYRCQEEPGFHLGVTFRFKSISHIEDDSWIRYLCKQALWRSIVGADLILGQVEWREQIEAFAYAAATAVLFIGSLRVRCLSKIISIRARCHNWDPACPYSKSLCAIFVDACHSTLTLTIVGKR